MSEFEIIISSPPDREDLVSEILFEHFQWVEISQETKDLVIQFYFYPNRLVWKFVFNEALKALEEARYELTIRTKPENCPLWVFCPYCDEMWETLSKEDNLVCPDCKKTFHNPHGPKLPNTIQMHEFVIKTFHPKNRKNLVVQIFYEDILWAEISQEHEELMLEFYPHPNKPYWEFLYDNTIEALQKAKSKLEKSIKF